MSAKAAVKKKITEKGSKDHSGFAFDRADIGDLSAALKIILSDFASMTVGELLSRDDVISLIEKVKPEIIDAKYVVKLGRKIADRVAKSVGDDDLAANDFLDAKLKKAFDDILDVDIELTESSKEFVGKVMRANFIRSLFTDVIHITLVNFYKKLNPLFGGLATKMLDTQIRSFIEMFIKIVLDHAVSFVVSPSNVSLFSDFAREVARLLMEEPVEKMSDQLSERHRDKIENAVILAMSNNALHKKLRELGIKIIEDIWPEIEAIRISELVVIKKIDDDLLVLLAKMISPVLLHPQLINFYSSLNSKEGDK